MAVPGTATKRAGSALVALNAHTFTAETALAKANHRNRVLRSSRLQPIWVSRLV